MEACSSISSAVALDPMISSQDRGRAWKYGFKKNVEKQRKVMIHNA